MKKLVVLGIFGCTLILSCAQKEEKREEFKEEHTVDEKRNDGVPVAAMSDSAQVKDSMSVETK